MATVLPTGVSAELFNAAVAAFEDALGPDAVVVDRGDLLEYRDPFTYRESDEFDASAMVMPTTTEQVQAVVRIANEQRVPLHTFSQGRNNTYGGPAPRHRGTVLVNLRNMNNVLEVNEELAYAVVQPGVRWFDLFDVLEQQYGGRLWTSIPDLGWGSVIGNSLDNGVGYTPYGDHASNIMGLEVVLANGELLRTGFGAIEDSSPWHTYPHAFGPQLRGLFQQSNFGIVTRMGWRLLPRPETYACCWVKCEGFGPLEGMVDSLRELMLDGIITNYPMAQHGIDVDGDGNSVLMPDSDLWYIRFALYGRQSVVDAKFQACQEVFGRVRGVELIRRDFAGTDRTGPRSHDEKVQAGIPDMDLLEPAMLPFGPDTAHLDFSPVGLNDGRSVVELERFVSGLYASNGFPYVGGISFSPRGALHFTTTFYDPHDKVRTTQVYDNYTRMLGEARKRGITVYRTNHQHQDMVADLMDFAGGTQLRVNEAIKDALDPKGILSPGKSGIWPAHLRGRH